jgi:hypothetical protein
MLTEPTKPNESGQTMCVVRWQVNMPDGLWLGAWDKEAFEAYTAPLLARIAELEADAKRLDFVEGRLFGKSWNGVIDSGSRTYWRIASDHRHITQKMVGHTFRDALDNAMKEQP